MSIDSLINIIPSASVIFSSSIILLGVSLTVRYNLSVQKKRATLDLIIKTESDKHYIELTEKFYELAKKKENLLTQIENDDSLISTVQKFLNHQEIIALSIRKGIIDEKFYKRWLRTSYVNHYEQAQQLIDNLRRDQKEKYGATDAYTNFMKLAQKWQKELAKQRRLRIDDQNY